MAISMNPASQLAAQFVQQCDPRLIDPVTNAIMDEPMTDEAGHSLDKDTLINLAKKAMEQGKLVFCPVDKEVINYDKLTFNPIIKEAIEQVKPRVATYFFL